MIDTSEETWIALRPRLTNVRTRLAFVEHARRLVRARRSNEFASEIEEVRSTFVEGLQPVRNSDRQALLTAGLILADLATQEWRIRVRRGVVEVQAPTPMIHDQVAEKDRVRRQELVKRDAQLRQGAAQKFIRSMERVRLFGGKFVSIFSLMRDGRELGKQLKVARSQSDDNWATALAHAIGPYLEFVDSERATCAFTGLRLLDVWRYFRHTWANQYTSVPGRTMAYLVRDGASAFHPVIGIGALSSPVMQIRERDYWIGWHPDAFLAEVQANPSDTHAKWLIDVVDKAIAEVYIDDLREDLIVNSKEIREPNVEVIKRLLDECTVQRRLHNRFGRSRDYKSTRHRGTNSERWVVQARTHLFRGKRALALATYLRARVTFRRAFGRNPTAEKLAALARTRAGVDAIRKTLKKAKSDRIGISVADLTVCGAVQPYNAVLGGKLVAMLSTSPEIVLEYRRRYSTAESQIASSVAGRPIVRSPDLVLLGTTSLYGIGSSQYNRIRIPCDRIGGNRGEQICFSELGRSEAFGTSQYSDETVEALGDLVQQTAGGRRINSIFGEGVSPKLRKVRHGLDLLGFPSEFLLRHHRRRVVYAVSLIRNLRDHLLGFNESPDYLVPPTRGRQTTELIAAWWRERWLRNRIASEDVLNEVERHTLVRPVAHGARVSVPVASSMQLEFTED